MKEKSIKKNILLSTLYQVLILIIPFITAPYISRVIGVEGVGIYSYTLSIQTYFSMFAALGTVTYGTREIARVRKDKSKVSKLFWEIELLTIITSFICLILWVILIGLSKNYRIYFLILTLNLFNTMFDISWLYSGLEEFKYTILKNALFKILGVILLFIFIKSPKDLNLYILIMSLTTLLGTMTMWLYLPKFIEKVNFKELKILPHFKQTLIYFVPTIATSVYTVLDKTLIGAITNNASENGYYEQATKIINMTKALTFTSLNMVLGSRISYLFAEKKIDEVKKRINTSLNYILFFGCGMMFGLIGISDNFIPLFFGKGYDKVILLTRLMSPLLIIIGISNCMGSQYYTPAGLKSKSSKFIIVGSIINLVLNLILIPRYWSLGAIIATIIAELTITILYIKNSNDFTSFKMIFKISWKKIISGIIMLILVMTINLLKLSKILKIIIQVPIGFLIYLVVLYIMKDSFIMDTKKYINSLILKRRLKI